MGYESYLRKRRISVSSRRYKPTAKHRHSLVYFSVFICRYFTGLSQRLRVDISKVTAHERIQLEYVNPLQDLVRLCLALRYF
jgi:hypothetical protein